jgi:hypothetical protein
MKKYLSLLLFSAAFSGISYGQAASNEMYIENNYVKVHQGLDPASANEVYMIWYRHVQDTTYIYKKAFSDSSYTKMLTKSFYKKDVLTGPFESYTDGALTFQGTYKEGQLDGETLTFYKGKTIQRAHYTAGIKTGIFEEFDLEGKRTKKATYDDDGHLVSVEKSLSN